MKNKERIALMVVLASGTLTVMTGSVIAPVVNLMRQGLGASASSVGVVITTHSLFISGITVASGTLSLVYWRFREKLSYRVMVTTAVAMDAGAFFLITGCARLSALAVAVGLFGMGMAFIFPTCFLWVGDLVPPSFRGRFSAYLLMTAFAAQFAVPVLLAPVMAPGGFFGRAVCLSVGTGAVGTFLEMDGIPADASGCPSRWGMSG
jgi:MFS family permease